MRHIPGLYLAENDKGRAMFCAIQIEEDDIIETCPLILLPEKEKPLIHGSSLHDYYFIWPLGGIAIALGYGSIYNHSSEPNAEVIFDHSEKEMIVKATRTIYPGEEILIDYTDGDKNHPLWFEEK